MNHYLKYVLNLGQLQRWYASHGTSGAQIHLEVIPWWCSVLQFVADRGCWPLHFIEFPDWPEWHDEDFGATTPKQCYGDLGCLWDWYVIQWVYQLTWKFTKDFWIPLTAEQQEKFTHHDTKIWWMQNQRSLEWNLKEERAKDECGDKT